MDAQRLPSSPASRGGSPALSRAVELPFSLQLKPQELRRLRAAVIKKFGHLFPAGVDPRYEADKMIDAQGERTRQRLIKQAVDRRWAS